MKQTELNFFLLTNCIPIPHESLFGTVKRLPKLFQWLVDCMTRIPIQILYGHGHLRIMQNKTPRTNDSVLILSLGCLWAIKMQDLLRSGFIPFPVFSSFIPFRMRMFFLLLWKKFDPLFLRCSRMGPIYPPKNNKTTCYWNIFGIWNIF